MSTERASAGRAQRYLPLVVATILASAGCGSSVSGSSHSVAGLKAAGHGFFADLVAGRYAAACETLTPWTLTTRWKGEGGCTAAYARFGRGSQALSHLPVAKVLLSGAESAFDAELSHVQIEGDRASNHAQLHAQYERGRWHFETPPAFPEEARPAVGSYVTMHLMRVVPGSKRLLGEVEEVVGEYQLVDGATSAARLISTIEAKLARGGPEMYRCKYRGASGLLAGRDADCRESSEP